VGRRSRYQRRKKLPGDRAALCDTCGVRYLRSQLARGPDGMLRCTGAGTMNDARGRTAYELGELEAQAAAGEAQAFDYGDDGSRIDDTEAEVAGGGGPVG
jgi:hypothetical protein